MIVITGASDGLGFQLAKLYKEAGKTVVNISRRECQYADENITLSLREGAEIEQAAKVVLDIEEPLEAIIHCAGTYLNKSWDDITEDEIKLLMSTNVKSQMLLTSKLLARIKKDKTDILSIGSTSATREWGSDNSIYSVSKWAVRGFVASLQKEFEKLPNRVISFNPGWFVKPNDPLRRDNPDSTEWMKAEDVAVFIKQILDLPKNMEVSEVVVNRKSAR